MTQPLDKPDPREALLMPWARDLIARLRPRAVLGDLLVQALEPGHAVTLQLTGLGDYWWCLDDLTDKADGEPYDIGRRPALVSALQVIATATKARTAQLTEASDD